MRDSALKLRSNADTAACTRVGEELMRDSALKLEVHHWEHCTVRLVGEELMRDSALKLGVSGCDGGALGRRRRAHARQRFETRSAARRH